MSERWAELKKLIQRAYDLSTGDGEYEDRTWPDRTLKDALSLMCAMEADNQALLRTKTQASLRAATQVN